MLCQQVNSLPWEKFEAVKRVGQLWDRLAGETKVGSFDSTWLPTFNDQLPSLKEGQLKDIPIQIDEQLEQGENLLHMPQVGCECMCHSSWPCNCVRGSGQTTTMQP